MSAVLHMDETTPHIHATVVPIVTGERRKAKREQTKNNGKRTYRKKKDGPRLCADDVMSRSKLKEYQTSYAEAMAKYGLKRGIEGSEAKHITGSQFYREVFVRKNEIAQQVEAMAGQIETLSVDIAALQAQREAARSDYNIIDEQRKRKQEELAKAEAELTQAKKEIKTDKLKGAAVEVGTTIIDGIGAMIGIAKVKRQEHEIIELRQEMAAREKTIEVLQTKIRTTEDEHGRQLLQIQQMHRMDLERKDAEHHKEIALLKTILSKAVAWFPYFREMLRMENLCRAVGFGETQTTTLLKGKSLEYNGELYSEECGRRFSAENVIARIAVNDADKRKLTLRIDGTPIAEWFKGQFDKQYRNEQKIKRIIRK